MPVGEVVRLIRDVVDALTCAHERGVIHRDIKPDNVLLSRHHALVTDFGVAKALSEATGRSSLTSAGVALGTPAYMAPEQATADPHVDHRADIYAVGALAYEMLAGRPPFIGPTPQAVLAAQVTQAVEPVSSLRPSVPPALAAPVMRCLEKRPADRWQTAEELLHQLEAMATPSSGTPPTEAMPATRQRRAQVPAAEGWSSRASRAAYLVLGLLLALGIAWGVSRYRGRGSSAASDDAQRVAVLPFENLGHPDDEYFAEGLTEEVTSRLIGIGGLKVIARSSARQYKRTTKPLRQIGQELGAAYVLEGTVRWEKVGDSTRRVRVSPELIRVADGTSVWSHGYDAGAADVFQVQSDIAQLVAGALHVALAAPERQALAVTPTRSPEAHDYYLRGKQYYDRTGGQNESDLRAAEQLFRKALELDPAFALAWAALSRTHDEMYWFFFDRTDTRLAQQKEAAERALRLASDLPQAHVAMGYYHYHAHLDYPAALQEFERARAGRPGESEVLAAIAVVQRRQGRFREAYANLKEAVALDPRSYYLLTEAGNTALRLKAFAEAEQYFSRTAVLSPDEPMVYMRLALTRLRMTGDTAAVREVIQAGVGHVGVEQLIRLVYRSGGSEILLIGLLPSQLSVRTELSATAGSLDSVSHYLWNADHLWYGGQERMAVAFADSGRVVLEHLVEQRPEESLYRSLLGLAYAMTGRRAEAMKQAEEAIAILPAEKDAFGSETPLWQSARICAIVGEKDLAVDRLRRIPSLSGKALRVSPYWVSLRGHPGFQRLVASR